MNEKNVFKIENIISGKKVKELNGLDQSQITQNAIMSPEKDDKQKIRKRLNDTTLTPTDNKKNQVRGGIREKLKKAGKVVLSALLAAAAIFSVVSALGSITPALGGVATAAAVGISALNVVEAGTHISNALNGAREVVAGA